MTSALLTSYRSQLEVVTARSTNQIGQIWDQLGTYDEEDVDRLASQAEMLVTAAKGATVITAAAYYASELNSRLQPVEASQIATALDFREPFTATWHALAESRPFDEAVDAGRSALEAGIKDFVTSTSRLTGDVVAGRSGIAVRWVRVAEPGCCDWCRARDGGIYPSAAAGDYGHKRCGCDMIPETLAAPRPNESAADQMARANRENKTKLRRELRTATQRQERARAEQLTETDPARRERLSTREQEAETTAERLTEQLARL